MADKKDDVRNLDQVKVYPIGNPQGGRALQAVKGNMNEYDGIDSHRTVVRETPEGRAIARTRDRMPMCTVEGGCEPIGIDHGTVDVLTIAPMHPDVYKDGKLYRTPFVAAHITGSAVDDPDRPIVDEIEPPDSVKGVAPADGAVAKSMRAKKIEDRDGLYAKKIMVGRCPPSIFTGRTRLYAQAIYGLHDELSRARLDVTLPSATPAILIGRTEETEFRLSTNCGIYYEAATAKHYMIEVGQDTVTFYPMECSDCVDAYRSYLLDPTFPEADKERVESYILGDSSVIKSKAQVVSITSTSAYSMGYGWHFNWDGDRADIVLTSLVAAPGGGEENESTHYRLTFAKNSKGKWSATRAIVEGPTKWKSLRHVEPITAPTWDDMVLEKIGAHVGPPAYGNAPFYVFYDRNTLRVCRYSCSSGSFAKTGITREPYYYDYARYLSVGSDPVNYRHRLAWDGVSTTISCGGVSISYAQESYVEYVYTRSSPDSGNIKQKYSFGPDDLYVGGYISLNGGQPGTIDTTVGPDIYWGTMETYSGGGGETGLSGWDTTSFGPFDGTKRRERGLLYCRANTEDFSSTTVKTTQFISVIPFYDSQAVYLHGAQGVSVNEIGTSKVDSAAWYAYEGIWEDSSILSIYGIAADPSGLDYVAEDIVSFNRTIASTNSTGKLISSAGTFNAVFVGSSGFWSGEESVPQQYPTFSSASGSTVIAPHNSVAEGESALTTAAAFVGWA